MAAADAGDYILDVDDEDFFEEYNPQPYLGGYDPAATYGSPLPPSADTCYPVSTPRAAALPPPTSPAPDPTDPLPEERYDDKEESPREPVYESHEVFPNGEGTEVKARRGRRRWRGFRRMCIRVLDYLFCYSDPYKEQRVGLDNHVVPVDTSKDDALAVKVKMAPPTAGRVQDTSQKLVQSNESLSYDVEDTVSGQPIHYYHHYYCEEPQHVHIETLEQISDVSIETFKPLWSQDWGLYDGYVQEDAVGNDIISDETVKPSWFQDWGLYNAYVLEGGVGNDTHSLVSDEYRDTGNLFISPFYPQEGETFEVAHSDGPVSLQQNLYNLSHWNTPTNDASLITKLADDSYTMNGSFWTFGEHSNYSI